MDDGSEEDLIEHLNQVHRKGTRGLTEDYLARLHVTLHQGERPVPPEHSHLMGTGTGEG